MEHYFSLCGINNDLQKLKVGVLYLNVERLQWWKWHKKAYKGYVITKSSTCAKPSQDA
jgi:hypothetical protein